jgi:excisionase family DNA binding protein
MGRTRATDGTQLVNAEAAAQALGVSRSTVYRLAKRAAIPCYQISEGVVRFDLQEILRMSRIEAART